ncbi:MAG: DUF6035 family protein [Bacteroidales bacterium]
MRKIKNAIDVETGEIINADESLSNELYAKHFRKRIDNKSEKLICFGCENELAIRPNTKNKITPTYYFYHRKNFSECDLVNEKIPQIELDKINKIYASKETKRHKDLKQAIFDKLHKIEFIDKESIKIEKWFFENGKLERRPDVFCIYNDKRIAFEVQISDLSQRYMLERYNYYKKEQMYVIWVVDYFDFENNRQFIKDIQELNNYQNIFRLDEKSDDLNFLCSFPEVFLNKNLEIKEKIVEKKISFNDLEFDNTFQVFYYDYINEIRKKDIEKNKILKKLEIENEQKEIEKKQLEEKREKEKENQWQLKWIKLTKQYNKNIITNKYLTEHCYCNIKPNNNIIVFFPEIAITETEIKEIEENNSNIIWVINTEGALQNGSVKSKVDGLLNTLEENFFQEYMQEYRDDLKIEIDNLKKALDEKQKCVENLEREISNIENEYSDITEIRAKIVSSILNNRFYYNLSDLPKTINELLGEQLLQLYRKNNEYKEELKTINQEIKTICDYPDEMINDKKLKVLPRNPDEKFVNDNFVNLTIIKKSTFLTLLRDIITKENLRFVFYNPKEYIYLFDFTQKLKDLEIRKAEIEKLLTECEINLEELNIKIDINIKKYAKEVLKKLSSDLKNAKLEHIKKQNDLQEATTGYDFLFEEYNNEKESIKSKYKDLYSFKWNEYISKWKNTKYSLFFDNDNGYVFWVNQEFQLKKIEYKKFINKLGTINKTLKKWV